MGSFKEFKLKYPIQLVHLCGVKLTGTEFCYINFYDHYKVGKIYDANSRPTDELGVKCYWKDSLAFEPNATEVDRLRLIRKQQKFIQRIEGFHLHEIGEVSHVYFYFFSSQLDKVIYFCKNCGVVYPEDVRVNGQFLCVGCETNNSENFGIFEKLFNFDGSYVAPKEPTLKMSNKPKTLDKYFGGMVGCKQ